MNISLMNARLHQAMEEFLYSCRMEVDACRMGNKASDLRVLADKLNDMEKVINRRLQGMQGQLNAQAFGRKD